MSEFPFMPLWTDAYLADTMDLTDSEHGLYLIMLMLSWRRSDCALPDDMKWLKRALQAQCANLHGHTFNAIVPRLLARFFVRQEGPQNEFKWVSNRLQKERKYLQNRSETQRKRAQLRWQNNDLADAMAVQPRNAPIPIPTPIKKKEKSRPPDGDLYTPEFESIWKKWPAKKSKAKAATAYIKALKRATAEVIAAGIERALPELAGTDPKFIKHLATWLNQECWLDEAAAPQSVADPELNNLRNQAKMLATLTPAARGLFSRLPSHAIKQMVAMGYLKPETAAEYGVKS
jgi:uncharacterized protein YdaU (DUF1376 family)